MVNMVNVEEIVRKGLCSACGACAAACPTGAVAMGYNDAGFLRASVEEDKCVKCQKCVAVCPGNAGNHVVQDPVEAHVLGTVTGSYIGYASETATRENGQSGGVVSALLAFLMESGKIDGAVVNSFDSREKRPVAIVAENKEDIIRAQGSYYSQTDVLHTYARAMNAHRNLAAVVLGCQARALRNLEREDKNFKPPVIKIGLFCGGQFSRHIIRDILDKMPISQDETVLGFRFRDKREGGVPGDVVVNTDKKKYVLPRGERIKLFDIWKCYRCNVCLDFYNTECDIVCADPWGVENPDMVRDGATVILARSAEGRKVIEEAVKAGWIYTEKLESETIFCGQGMLEKLAGVCGSGSGESRYATPFSYCGTEALPRTDKQFHKNLAYTNKLYFSKGKVLEKLIRKKERACAREKRILNFKVRLKKTLLKK